MTGERPTGCGRPSWPGSPSNWLPTVPRSVPRARPQLASTRPNLFQPLQAGEVARVQAVGRGIEAGVDGDPLVRQIFRQALITALVSRLPAPVENDGGQGSWPPPDRSNDGRSLRP